MIPLPQRETKLLVAIHGWTSIILGFLLYAVVLTGAVAVLAKEVGHWSVKEVKPANPLTMPINNLVRDLSEKVGRAYRDDVSINISTSGKLHIFFHKHIKTARGFTRDRGVLFEVDPQTRQILNRREGLSVDLRNTDPESTLARFLIDTHVRLYMPRPWGLLVTGVLGLVMMVAAVTGLFMHRHLLRDIFTLRSREKSLLGARDNHSVAASWSLPFAFLLAFTGCFFSFATSFGIPALAMVAFGGNQAQLVRTVMGTSFARPGRRVETSNIDNIIKKAGERAKLKPIAVSIEHFGRKNEIVSVVHMPKLGGLEAKTLQYHGVDGMFKRELPSVGTVPSLGATLVTIIAPLHFGNFAGILSKAVWVALGFASCYIIISGLKLWVRRREEQAGWRFFERFVHLFGLGLPICLIASAIVFFVYRDQQMVVDATPLGFAITGLGLTVIALLLPARQLEKLLWTLLIAGLVVLPVFRYATGGPGWIAALSNGVVTVVAMDLFFIITGLATAWMVYADKRSVSVAATQAG